MPKSVTQSLCLNLVKSCSISHTQQEKCMSYHSLYKISLFINVSALIKDFKAIKTMEKESASLEANESFM